MTQLSDKILDTIKKTHVTPVPRWQFLAKNYAVWVAFGVSVVLGSIAFSIMAERIVRNDWDIYLYLDKSFFGFLMIALPYAWIVSLVAFALVAYFNCRHTKCGYRYAPYMVVIVSIGTSIILGEIMYVCGAGHFVDRVLTRALPFYRDAKMQERRSFWMNPQRGLIMGEVIEIGEGGMMLVRDTNGVVWRINDGVGHVQIPHPQLQRSIVKVIGRQAEGGGEEFFAKDIRLCDYCEEEMMERK